MYSTTQKTACRIPHPSPHRCLFILHEPCQMTTNIRLKRRPWRYSRTLQGMFVCCCYLLPGGGRFRPVTAAALSSISIINGGTQRRIKFRRGSSLRVGRRMASTSSFDAAAAASSAYSSFDLSGKTALITGSSGGIGKAMWHWHSPRPVPMLSCITIHEERVLSLHSEKSIVVIVRW